jgi:MFS superfamily sulfate permease-like transporter
MPKPTTGRIHPELPPPDPEQLASNTLMTSVFTGASLIVSTFALAVFGSVGLFAGRSWPGDPITGAQLGMAAGLLIGAVLLGMGLRRLSARIRARSSNLYRGAWIGMFFALGIIIAMAYAPWLIPSYCPPGASC